MADRTEAIASQWLCASLAPLSTGTPIENSKEYLAFQSALERFLPAELGWEGEITQMLGLPRDCCSSVKAIALVPQI